MLLLCNLAMATQKRITVVCSWLGAIPQPVIQLHEVGHSNYHYSVVHSYGPTGPSGMVTLVACHGPCITIMISL